MNMHEAQKKTLQIMVKAKLIENGWTFGWDNSARRLGRCSAGRRIITLSRGFTFSNEWEVVHQTVLHEIAHALQWELFKEKPSHNKTHKALCAKLGVSTKTRRANGTFRRWCKEDCKLATTAMIGEWWAEYKTK